MVVLGFGTESPESRNLLSPGQVGWQVTLSVDEGILAGGQNLVPEKAAVLSCQSWVRIPPG